MTHTRSPFAGCLLALTTLLVACGQADRPPETDDPGGWPDDLTMPIEGATFSMSAADLPAIGEGTGQDGPPRDGFRFLNGSSGRLLAAEQAIRSVADGVVLRIDHDYADPEAEALDHWATLASEPGLTGEFARDRLRGRQVWIRHEQGHVSRYAHLSAVHPQLKPGDGVEQGQVIGLMGASGLRAGDDSAPAAQLLFELWSDDGQRFLGQGLEVLAIHRRLAEVFGPESLPRHARQVVARVERGEAAPGSYPPADPPDYGFMLEPPQSIVAGAPFAIPVTWEKDDFSPADFYPMLGREPMGVIDSGDGAWILGATPLENAGSETELTVLAIDPFGVTLAGSRTLRTEAPPDTPPPGEVAAAVIEAFSDENRRLEQSQVTAAAVHSLRLREPQWSEPFRPPLEGTVTGAFGQKRFHGITVPAYPRPGVLIQTEPGTQVSASNRGTVVVAEHLLIRGNTIAISHGGGIVSFYAGLAEIGVEPGALVEHGQPVGLAGDELQWEVHVAGMPSNPLLWLDKLLPGR